MVPTSATAKAKRGGVKTLTGERRTGADSLRWGPRSLFVKYRILGRTGLKVSEVGFGAWAIGGNAHGNSYGPTDDQESVRAVQRAVELGCNFFDTADVYGHGHSESLLGQALADHPDAMVATKVGGDFYHGPPHLDFTHDYVRFAVRESLKRLRRDAIDLYQLHNPDEALLGAEPLYEVLDELREQGVVRHYGVSVHTAEDAMAALAVGKPSTIQLPFSLVRQEWVEEILPLAAKKNVGIIAREPLGNGFLTGKYDAKAAFVQGDIRHRWPPRYRQSFVDAAGRLAPLAMKGRTRAQAALRFVLDHPQVATVIPGCKTPAHVDENMGASGAPPLSAADLQGLRAAFP